MNWIGQKTRLLFYAIKHWSKIFFEGFPNLYLGLSGFGLAWKGWCGSRITSNQSEVVIEGFPRSGNSFATDAFRFAQGRHVFIGNHLHAVANIRRGVDKGKPVLVLIRNPRDAILSICAREALASKLGSSWDIRRKINIQACRYFWFYKRINRIRDKVVLVSFSDVTCDYGKVIDQLNDRFKTNFIRFEHHEENVNRVFRGGREHLSPSAARSEMKARLMKEWEKIADSKTVKKADNIYRVLATEAKRC